LLTSPWYMVRLMWVMKHLLAFKVLFSRQSRKQLCTWAKISSYWCNHFWQKVHSYRYDHHFPDRCW
jgi:hypothetical protein